MSAIGSTFDALRSLGLIVQGDHLRDEPPVCYLSKIENVDAETWEARKEFLKFWRGPQHWSGSRGEARALSAAARNLARWDRERTGMTRAKVVT